MLSYCFPFLVLQIIRAAEVTNMRGGRFMSIEDIIFLMRKDKVFVS